MDSNEQAKAMMDRSGELYIALQQGLVEAQENAYDTIVASKLFEQQKYIVNTHHVIMWSGMYMNLDFYNSLPADYQELISAAQAAAAG